MAFFQLVAFYLIIYFLVWLFFALPFYKYIDGEQAATICAWVALAIFVILCIVSLVWNDRQEHPLPHKENRKNILKKIRKNISNDAELLKQYSDILNRETFLNDYYLAKKSETFGSIIPTLWQLKHTTLKNYYKMFYKTPQDLALLYLMEQNPNNPLTEHPLNQEIISTFDNADDGEWSDKTLTSYPWLIRLDLGGIQQDKNKKTHTEQSDVIKNGA